MTRPVAIVTGGASGIGRALAEALTARGVRVVVADLDGDGAHRVASALPSPLAEAVEVDVADAAAVRDVVERTADRHGELDLLFNNAGVDVSGEPEDLTLAHWQRAIDVNLRGAINGAAAAYPIMVAQGRGHIVNTASIAGLVPTGSVAYATTKAGVVGFSLALRAAGADRGVRVSALCPGVIETPMLDSRGSADLPNPMRTDARTVVGRLRVRPYPPQRLAEDALRGVARNDALIVAPASARAVWRLARLSPRLASAVAVRAVRVARSVEADVRAGNG